jgi:hypothetical protein
MDDVVREKEKVIDDSHRMEQSYQRTISDSNADIAELRSILLFVKTTVKEREKEIRLHESSYRETLLLSLQPTRERLGKRTRATREHLGNKVRKIVNKLLDKMRSSCQEYTQRRNTKYYNMQLRKHRH